VKICLVSDDRLHRGPDGVHYSNTGYDWRAFANLFGPELEQVKVLARVTAVDAPPPGWAPHLVDDRTRIAGLPWFDKYRALVKLPAAMWRLRRELRDADVVWLVVPNVYPTLAYVVARALRKPVLAWCVGDVSETALMVYDELPMRLAHRLYARITRAIVRRADAGIVASETLGRKYAGRRPLTVAYRALRDPSYLAMERPVRAPRTILYLGRLSPEKGTTTLLTAFEKVVEKLPDARLVLAGEGPQRPELESHARRAGMADAIEMPGWIEHGEQLKTLLARADVLCLPSYSEGMPAALIEAMSAGLPVVGSEVGDIPAVISAQRAGLTVPPRDEDALAAALLDVLSDGTEYARMSEAAVATARARSFEQETGRVVHAALRLGRGEGGAAG
jgi:glycosyltransferase involved in cell wall biosynthesis